VAETFWSGWFPRSSTILKGRDTVNDVSALNPEVTVTACAPEALLRLDLWTGPADGVLPNVGHALDAFQGRLIGIEPAAWLLRAPMPQESEAGTWLAGLAGDHGAVIVLTGGLVRFRLEGARWRELLTINAVFDVENPAFAPGSVAATILNHAAIWIDVVTDAAADVYCLPSYSEHLATGWRHAISRMD
jgi:heterotetrameric sarcosine oxidase gamma subunit